MNQAVYFSAPRQIELRDEALPQPAAGHVRVRTVLSGISAGTELLIYRGEAPRALQADASIAALAGGLAFPLKYGYAAVGDVDALGAGVDVGWLGQRVFAFNPHERFFVSALADLQRVPAGIDAADAVMLPNVESAVNFVLDAQPLLGEVAAVVGQGVVGLLTTALLARMPLAGLLGVERLAARRDQSLRLGANAVVDPSDAGAFAAHAERADVVFELSGAPAALDTAIALTGFGGRIVIGSWYGAKPVTVDLGGRFHRSRIKLISSQVSTLTPELAARWDKPRRLAVAWQMLRAIQPSRLITQRVPFADAAAAYAALDERPADALQVVLDYAARPVRL